MSLGMNEAMGGGGVVEQLIADDIDSIAASFQNTFEECVRRVKKPNVLVMGVR